MEILAPAGNLATFYVAVNNGANAVYLGLKDFSARKGAENFSLEELEVALKYARVMGVKVYVTLNTLIKESELEGFFGVVLSLYRLGVDAVILQDLFLGKYLAERIPELELHLSTQGGVNNLEGALVAKAYGFKRVILARETPLNEIEKIAEIIDTEVFVQGALCTSFSGHCYMSSFGGGNSGNRGLCKQPCRRKYTLNGNENYAICTSDLSLGDKVLELERKGVKSFKIEGRMRRAEYVGAAVLYYRSIFYPNEKYGDELSALKRTFNRGNYTLGLGFGQKNDFLSTKAQGHIGERVGVIKSIKGNKIYVQGSLNPQKGDGFKILRNGEEVGSAECSGEKGGTTQPLNYKGEVKVGDEVYVTTDTRLNKELTMAVGLKAIEVYFSAKEGERPIVKVYADGDLVAVAEGEAPFETAVGKALDQVQIEEIFSKVDRYPFNVEHCHTEIEGRLFAPRSVLNAIRRKAYEIAYEKLSYRAPKKEITLGERVKPVLEKPDKTIAVIAERFKGVENYDIAIFAPSDYNEERYFKSFFLETAPAKERYLYVPSLLSEDDVKIIQKRINGFDGIYGENPCVLELAEKYHKKLFLGTDFNVFNGLSFSIAKDSAEHVAFSKELTEGEIKSTTFTENAFVQTRGDVKVMELGYCPYGKKCSRCTAPVLNTLTDYAGRKFTLMRIKLSKCYFEIYNPQELIYDDFNLSLYNFVLRRDTELINRRNASVKEYRERFNTTSGHLKNGVN